MEPGEVTIVNLDEMADTLEERGIRPEDVREVIAQAETTGHKFQHADDASRFLARTRLENFNCYAEYAPEGDGFRLHGAYAHRVMLTSDDLE